MGPPTLPKSSSGTANPPGLLNSGLPFWLSTVLSKSDPCWPVRRKYRSACDTPGAVQRASMLLYGNRSGSTGWAICSAPLLYDVA